LLPQRAKAALRAISVRRFAVNAFERAGPPFFPIMEKTLLTISGEGSACSFFFGMTIPLYEQNCRAPD
jgi:hypothetical protein